MARRFGFSAVLLLIGGVMTLIFSGVLSAASYADPQGRFSFTVPDGWQQAPPPSGLNLPQGTSFAVGYMVPALKTNNFPTNVSIVTITLPAAAPLADVASGALSQLAQTPGYQAVGSGLTNLTLGGKPAAMFQYTLTDQGKTAHLEQIVTLNGTTAYLITLAADPADFAALAQQAGPMLSSWAWGSAPAVTGPTTAVGSAPALPAAPVAPPPTATRPPTVVPAAPKTGEGGGADYVRRLGDG